MAKRTAARTVGRLPEAAPPAATGARKAARPKPKREVDPERTRQKLLDAARVEFAAKGLKGGRISGIARRAGTNYQAIYHHFGSKEKIYLAVLEHLYSDDWTLGAKARMEELPPVEAVAFFLNFLAEKYRTDPAYGAILLDENIHRARHLKMLPVAKGFYARLVGSLEAVLKRGQAEGLFRREVEALDFYFIAVGALSTPMISRFTMSENFDRDLDSEEGIRAWSGRAIDFLLHGLRVP